MRLAKRIGAVAYFETWVLQRKGLDRTVLIRCRVHNNAAGGKKRHILPWFLVKEIDVLLVTPRNNDHTTLIWPIEVDFTHPVRIG
jgi:hypothetical protein